MPQPSHTRTWPSLAVVPALYPDARNRINRGPLLYRAGKCFPLRRPIDTSGRIPLLAVGSNAYPRQLADKLVGTIADLQGLPLLPTIMRGFDVAYCPVRSRKGYVPVTLASRPGAVCLTWMQWLTIDQLNLISASEGPRYALVGGAPLADASLMPAQWRKPAGIFAWWFDSLLCSNDTVAWLDVFRPPGGQQSGLELEHSAACPNPVPEGWRVIPREPARQRIDPELMSALC
ncbi:MAG: hypothetical protein OXH13_03035 [Chloroflexi bacterium]|nr:hypothetical protein [Chloroflexota bacterium]MCY3696997.1 hypothetical protein [Chloroflexota bacterium]